MEATSPFPQFFLLATLGGRGDCLNNCVTIVAWLVLCNIVFCPLLQTPYDQVPLV